MLKLNTKEMVYTIQMPIDPTYKIISTKLSPSTKETIIMTGIDEDNLKKLKNNDDINITRGGCIFKISSDDVFCFGEIDFHEGSEDCEVLDSFDWLDQLYSRGVSIPSRYNYDKHECYSPIKIYLSTETFRNSPLCRYLHGCLGKPQYTLIFREIK